MINFVSTLIKNVRCRIFPGRAVAEFKKSWLMRCTPFSQSFGMDRGSAIDRFFIDRFIYENTKLVTGNILEIGDDQYTVKYGSNVIRSVVLNGDGKKSDESYFGDLANLATLIELGIQDCVIATNVINFIYDFDAAIKGLSKLVKPNGGVCLCTVAGLVCISRYDYDRWGDYWRFTDMSIRMAFEKYFEIVEVESYGNAPLASAFIMGLSQEEVPDHLFSTNDPNYQILITIKAKNPIC